MTHKAYIETPEHFSFISTIKSHGWSQLYPFQFDYENEILTYVFGNEFLKNPVSAAITHSENKLTVEINEKNIGKKASEKILRDVRHILRFDDDIEGFYKLARKNRSISWVCLEKGGRLLRSPTVFEDLVKTICTTNCSWSLTKKMVKNLVENLGDETKDGRHAFPTAEQMAEAPTTFYRETMRAGYRSDYFPELAEKVASGKLNPEKWLHTDLPTDEIKKEMKKIKGVGDYAAENLLKLVGRYDGLALDSWLRGQFYKKHNNAAVCDDGKIKDYYEKFGSWRGLAIWCDMSGSSN